MGHLDNREMIEQTNLCYIWTERWVNSGGTALFEIDIFLATHVD